MIADYLVELEKRVEALEKEVAELKVQVSTRPTIAVEELSKEIFTLLSSKARDNGITG